MNTDATIIHICNDGTPRNKEVASQIRSDHEFENHVSAPASVYLLNINLNWDGRKLSSDYGFDVANTLRTKKKALGPIIFYSYVPVEYFEYKARKSLRYKLLFGRGSAFLGHPFTKKQLQDAITATPPLTEAARQDLVATLADIKGLVIERLNHDLKFGAKIAGIFDELEPFLTDAQKSTIQLDRYKPELVRTNEKRDRNSFTKLKEAFVSLCNSQLIESGQTGINSEKAPYSILLVEDDREYRERAYFHLSKRFGAVTAVEGAEEAIRTLEADTCNNILAVITDWRLYKDSDHTYWQQCQGYEVLERAARTGHRALFALTSQPDFLIHHIRNSMGIRFQLFKKQNFENLESENEEQWSIFADAIRNGCSDALSYASSLVKSKNWTKEVNGLSYRDLYIDARNRVDSDAFFSPVFQKANDVWKYVIENELSNFAHMKIVRDEFGLEIPKKNLDLSVILIWRLIWFGLAIRYSDPTSRNPTSNREDFSLADRVYWVLYTGFRKFFEPDPTSVNQEKIKLCLTDNDLVQRRMLPHERMWLLQKGLLTE